MKALCCLACAVSQFRLSIRPVAVSEGTIGKSQWLLKVSSLALWKPSTYSVNMLKRLVQDVAHVDMLAIFSQNHSNASNG